MSKGGGGGEREECEIRRGVGGGREGREEEEGKGGGMKDWRK